MAIVSAGIALPVLFFHHIMGRILDCLKNILFEIKESVLCVKKALFKCLSLLCCCSCSCKIGKCRLCRRRLRGDSEYDDHEEEEEERKRINQENQEIDGETADTTNQKKSQESNAQTGVTATTGGHPFHSRQYNTTSLNGDLNGTVIRSGSRAEYTRLFDQTPVASNTRRTGSDIYQQRKKYQPVSQCNGHQPTVHFNPSTTSSPTALQKNHRQEARPISPPLSSQTELQPTGRDVSRQKFLRTPVIGRSPRHVSSHAVKSITPGFVGLEQSRR
jgi:hypothetical protein